MAGRYPWRPPSELTSRITEVGCRPIRRPITAHGRVWSSSWAEIARRTGRHPTTIMREVEANGGRGRYRPAVAEHRAGTPRCRVRPRRLKVPGMLRDRVSEELKLARSPVAIWADLVAEDATERVCVETIYPAVYAGVLDVKPTECLRTRRSRRRRRQGRHETKRPGLPNIVLRPAVVNERAELGHWEGDQIIGRSNRSSVLWLTERVTRYSIPVTMPEGYDGDAMLAGLVCGLEQIPPYLLRSITFEGVRVGLLGDHRSELRHRRLVLRPPQPVAAWPGREPQPSVALLVPSRH
jgi:IS30 family transposase